VKAPRLKTGVAAGLHLWAPAPTHNGSQTSRAAAERVEKKSPSLRYVVLKEICRHGVRGATHEEIAIATGTRLDSVKARVHELGVTGRVRGLRRTRPTSTGSPAMVFIGVEWAQDLAENDPLTDWPRTRESHWKKRALEAEAELARLRANHKGVS
jgi:hypothetical protein